MITRGKTLFEEKVQLAKNLQDVNLEEQWDNIKRYVEDAADKLKEKEQKVEKKLMDGGGSQNIPRKQKGKHEAGQSEEDKMT